MKLTTKQEKFCVAYFQCGNAGEAAIAAGYKAKNARQIGYQTLQKPLIAARLKALQEKIEAAAVMDVQERKARLTEIARARLSDFVISNKDGHFIKVTDDSVNSAALQAITTSTKFYKNGMEPLIITDLKLHDPVRAIAELNKMEHVYEVAEATTINNDNRTMNITVISPEAKELTEKLLKDGGV